MFISSKDPKDFLTKGDLLRERFQEGILILLTDTPKEALVAVMVTKNLLSNPKCNAKAILEALLKPIGGRGGGKDTLAQGKVSPDHKSTLLKEGMGWISEYLK